MKSLVTISALGLLGAALFVGCGDDGESSSGGTGASGSGGGGVGGAGGAGSDPLAHLAQAELERNTRFLASDEMAGRGEGTAQGAAARAYIIEELQKCGVEPAGIAGESGFEHPITASLNGISPAPVGPGTNILGKVTGTDPTLAARHIMLVAHYDHIGDLCAGCNGANDNAASVAIAIGVACAVAKEPLPRSVVFAGFDSEEPPTFQTAAMGSIFYTANPVIPLEQTDVALVMELVGGQFWPGFTGHFWMGTEHSPEVAAAFDAAPVPEGLMPVRGGVHLAEETPTGFVPWADHDAFREQSVPFVLISNGQNKHYHEVTDTVDNLSFPMMALEAQYLFDIVKNLGNAQANPTYVENATDYPKDVETVQWLLGQALAPGGIVESLGLTAESRALLEADVVNVEGVAAKVGAGSEITTEDVQLIRNAGQHVLCLGGSTYSESTCGLF